MQQQVVMTYHFVCAGQASTICSCSDTLWWHVAGTNHFVCTWEFLWKSLSLHVTITSHTNSVWFDFLRNVAATKFCLGDKDFYKNSSVHTNRFVTAMGPHDMFCNLSPSVYWPLVIIQSFKSNPYYLLVSLSQSLVSWRVSQWVKLAPGSLGLVDFLTGHVTFKVLTQFTCPIWTRVPTSLPLEL